MSYPDYHEKGILHRTLFFEALTKFSIVYRYTTSINVRNLDMLTISKNLTENSIFFDIPKTPRGFC